MGCLYLVWSQIIELLVAAVDAGELLAVWWGIWLWFWEASVIHLVFIAEILLNLTLELTPFLIQPIFWYIWFQLSATSLATSANSSERWMLQILLQFLREFSYLLVFILIVFWVIFVILVIAWASCWIEVRIWTRLQISLQLVGQITLLSLLISPSWFRRMDSIAIVSFCLIMLDMCFCDQTELFVDEVRSLWVDGSVAELACVMIWVDWFLLCLLLVLCFLVFLCLLVLSHECLSFQPHLLDLSTIIPLLHGFSHIIAWICSCLLELFPFVFDIAEQFFRTQISYFFVGELSAIFAFLWLSLSRIWRISILWIKIWILIILVALIQLM